jgi:hypothetical protein
MSEGIRQWGKYDEEGRQWYLGRGGNNLFLKVGYAYFDGALPPTLPLPNLISRNILGQDRETST